MDAGYISCRAQSKWKCGPLVQKLLRTSRQRKQSVKPSVGPLWALYGCLGHRPVNWGSCGDGSEVRVGKGSWPGWTPLQDCHQRTSPGTHKIRGLPAVWDPSHTSYVNGAHKAILQINCHHKYGGFPGGASMEEPTGQCRRQKRRGFNPWVGKIPWRRARQSTPVSCLENPHGQRSLAGHSPWGLRVRHNWELSLSLSFLQITSILYNIQPL